MFGGNDGLLRSTIGNPKYLGGPGGLGGLGGLDMPPPEFNGFQAKILSIFLGIFVCMLARFVPLRIYGLDFILRMVWASAVVNGDSIIVTKEWGIATKFNGIDLIGSTLKLEVLT